MCSSDLSLSNLIFLLLVVLILAALGSGAPPPLRDNTALLLNPSGVVVEELSYRDPVEVFLGAQDGAEREVLLADVLDAIALARDDASISALVMNLDGLRYVGITKSLEIGAALEAFKGSGKPVIAVADYISQDQYLLTSFADEILLNRHGGLFLEGYSSYRNYFKDALDKLRVDMHVFVAGTNKDAVEPLLSNQMSASNREINLGWLTALWQQYTGAVEGNRNLADGSVDAYIAAYDANSRSAGGDFGTMALNASLVDKLLTRSEMNHQLIDIVGASDEDGYFRAVDYQQYLGRNGFHLNDDDPAQQVGVVVARGVILDGEQPAGRIGGDTLAGLIRDARRDDSIAALVIRIDSGGGSAFASELVRQEILNAQAAGIPVVASMGAVAEIGRAHV